MRGTGGSGLTADALKGIELRSIGPTIQTGRIAGIAIDPKNPSVWYMASAFGGLWKTTNPGISFLHVVLRLTAYASRLTTYALRRTTALGFRPSTLGGAARIRGGRGFGFAVLASGGSPAGQPHLGSDMTFEQLDVSLPNGFHDAMIENIAIDYVQRSATLRMELLVGTPGSANPEEYRSAALDVAGYAEDSTSFPLDELRPATPEALTWWRFFVHDWNAFMHIAAEDVQFSWIDG